MRGSSSSCSQTATPPVRTDRARNLASPDLMRRRLELDVTLCPRCGTTAVPVSERRDGRGRAVQRGLMMPTACRGKGLSLAVNGLFTGALPINDNPMLRNSSRAHGLDWLARVWSIAACLQGAGLTDCRCSSSPATEGEMTLDAIEPSVSVVGDRTAVTITGEGFHLPIQMSLAYGQAEVGDIEVERHRIPDRTVSPAVGAESAEDAQRPRPPSRNGRPPWRRAWG